MSLRTSISSGGAEGIRIRGYALTDLMAGAGFADVVHLMLRGELPDRAIARMIEAILVSSVDHGPNAPSIHVARAMASCGVPLATAVGGGIAAIGTNHGGAGEACARILQEALADPACSGSARSGSECAGSEVSGEGRSGASPAGSSPAIVSGDARSGIGRADKDLASIAADIVRTARASGAKLPGYGHRVYKDADPRTEALFALAGELGLPGDHARLARLVAEELERITGKRLVLNVDGAQAAILSDLGFSWSQVQALFIIGRSVGLCAQAAEEIASSAPLAYLKSAPVSADYVGPGPREIPHDREVPQMPEIPHDREVPRDRHPGSAIGIGEEGGSPC